MKMKNYIEIGATKAGGNKALAKILGQSEVALCEAKSGKRGLNDAICIKLADYIEVDRIEVIAASNLVTEKDEERRKIFESCFSRAASIVIATSVISILALAPTSPTHAASTSAIVDNTNYWQLL